MSLPRLIALCSSALVLAACAEKQPQPIMVSAAGLPSYAIGYPNRLTAETNLLVADKQQADEQSQKLSTRAAELKPGADPTVVIVVVQQADQAGRTEAYARVNADSRSLREFWEEERGPISSRANGAAQKQLTEGNCGTCSKLELGGTLSYAIGSGIDKQLEKRLHAANEAYRTIEYNQDRIGVANVPTVQKLADDIALTSYQVNVALPQDRDRVDALLSESDDVDATLAHAIDWEHNDYQANARSPADKRNSQERVALLEKSRAAIPPAVSAGQAARKDLDPQIEALRKRYAETLEALEKELEAQQERAAK
jgi:hypothetical protein